MKNKTIFFTLILALAICLFPVKSVFAGPGTVTWLTVPETDNSASFGPGALGLFYVFDLRDRETFLQFTYQDDFESGLPLRAHVQIFDVSNNCNENNFFDVYTINDTHSYNLRNIITNDGSPSGVALSDGAYGIVVISYTTVDGQFSRPLGAIGNLRIFDNNGYEYRTNAQQSLFTVPFPPQFGELNPAYTFNFNIDNGVTLSDVIGVTVNLPEFPESEGPSSFFEWDASNTLSAYNAFDIDIFDNNEVPFSCRDITFACVNQDHPLLEELLAESGTSVASFEYGINNAIPHSKGGELLCPGNTISEGFVTLNPEVINLEGDLLPPHFFGFVGLNNGNGRGSMDSLWVINTCILIGDGCFP